MRGPSCKFRTLRVPYQLPPRSTLLLQFKMSGIACSAKDGTKLTAGARRISFNDAVPCVVGPVDVRLALQIARRSCERNLVVEVHSLPRAVKSPLPLLIAQIGHDAGHDAVQFSISRVPGACEHDFVRHCGRA